MRKINSVRYLFFVFVLVVKSLSLCAQTASPTDYFRSAQTGMWNVAGTWESSPDGVNNWLPSALIPTSAANTIAVRSGHNVTINSNTVVDQVVVAGGAILNIATGSSLALTVADGPGTDITVQSGGIFRHSITGTALPVFNEAAKLEIQSGGILEIANNNGVPSNYANTASPTASHVLWNDGSILNWNSTGNPVAGVTYFPASAAIPIFRFSKTVTIGGTANTAVNGLLEAIADVNFSSSGNKTLRNGISGSGKVAVTAISGGQLIISGTTAILGGIGVLQLGSKGLSINSGTILTLTSNKTINNFGTTTITISGTLIAGDYVIGGTGEVQIDGTVKTTNVNGLSGGTNTTFAGGFIVNTPGPFSVLNIAVPVIR